MTRSHTWTTSANIPKPRRPKAYNDYKVYYSGFPKETPELKFRLRFVFSFSHSLQVLNTHARRFDSDEHMAWCNGGRRKVYAWEGQQKYCVQYAQTDTKYSRRVRGRPTLKDEECLREISL